MQNDISLDLDELLALQPSPWGKLSKANVFITGPTSVFGRWMLESLLWAIKKLRLNTTVTALVRNPDAWSKSLPHLANHVAVKTIQGDILNRDFPSGQFSHFVHLAAPSGKIQASNPLYSFDLILNGTRNVLDLALATRAKRFLFVSSGSVYGRHFKDTEFIHETCREAPDPMAVETSAYDEGKRAGELLCSLYRHHYGLETVSARCFSFVGPFLPLNEHFAAGNFIRDALAGGPITVNGDGTPIRSYLYFADLAWWLWTILVDGQPGQAYNVGGEEPVSVGDLANLVSNFYSPPIQVKILRKGEKAHKLGRLKETKAGQILSRQVPDVTKAKQELGLYCRLDLKTSLKRTLSWFGAI
jgi:dTDP-glucose 4,6-dehydratase